MSGSRDGEIRIWNVEQGGMTHNSRVLGEHDSEIDSVTFSSNDEHLISGLDDHKVVIWNVRSEWLVNLSKYTNLHSFTCSFSHEAHTPPCVLVISQFESDVKTGKTIMGPSCGHSLYFRHMVNSVSLSHDDKHILSCSSDETIRIWDSEAGESVQDSFQGHTAGVQCVALSNDGTWIVSGSSDRMVCIWGMSTGRMVGQLLEGHKRLVWCIAFSPDRKHVVSGLEDLMI